MTFKPGDRVIVNNGDWQNEVGTVVLVASRNEYMYKDGDCAIRMDSYLDDYGSEDNAHRIHKSDITPLARVDGTPTYYDFPGGVQVRDISAHLTSFGGQALQYVARATRLDGNNKGEAVKDLRKALDFIGWEIERLESNA